MEFNNRKIRRTPGINLDEDIDEQITQFQLKLNANNLETSPVPPDNTQNSSILVSLDNNYIRRKYFKRRQV